MVDIHPVIAVVVDKVGGNKKENENSSEYDGWAIPGTTIGVGLYLGIGISRDAGITPDVGGGVLIGKTGVYLAGHASIGYKEEEGNGFGVGILYPFVRVIGFESAAAATLGYTLPEDTPYLTIVKAGFYLLSISSVLYSLYRLYRNENLRNLLKNKMNSGIEKLRKSLDKILTSLK